MNTPTFRPETNDEHIWDNIVKNNEYRLPDRLNGWVVIDVGAHIGAFTYACVQRGVDWVWAYEADVRNVDLFARNLAGHIKRTHITWGAVYNPVVEAGQTRMLTKTTDIAGRINSGSRSIILDKGVGEEDYAVPLISFDDILDQVHFDNAKTRKILVKLDCEGSEWPILFCSSKIHLADMVIGEWHARPLKRRIRNKTYYTVHDLVTYFENRNFSIEVLPHDDTNELGLFFAKHIPKGTPNVR